VILYRIAGGHHPVFDGAGAAEHGGRWNSPGRLAIYASTSFSLAMLEQLAHTRTGHLPRVQVFIEITVPPAMPVETLDPNELPGWDTEDCMASRAFGDRWLGEARTCVLLVPSVIVPTERNAAINPAHADFAEIVASDPRPVVWDRRLGALET
jgi:RES domain-containing protein